MNNKFANKDIFYVLHNQVNAVIRNEQDAVIAKRGRQCLILERVTKERVSELIFRLNYGG